MTEIAISQTQSGIADNALISAYLQGDEYAFEVLVTRYQNKLVNYLNRLIHDYEMAVDLAQEAFIRVIETPTAIKGSISFRLGCTGLPLIWPSTK